MLKAEAALLPLAARAAGAAPGPVPAAAAGRVADEAALAARIRSGDERAFESFFTTRYAALTAYLAAQVGSSAVAEELAQDVFLRIWQGRSRIDPQRPLTSYLFRAARNAAINRLRRDRRERAWQRLQKLLPVRTAAGADEVVHARELATAADAAVAALPERCRVIFLLSREQGLTYREIAASLGISIKTVETQMGRAIRSLSERLAPHI